MYTAPSIAQLVERWTVDDMYQISIGRWFKSGSKDFYGLESESIFILSLAHRKGRIFDKQNENTMCL
jgi:hypothetical protein